VSDDGLVDLALLFLLCTRQPQHHQNADSFDTFLRVLCCAGPTMTLPTGARQQAPAISTVAQETALGAFCLYWAGLPTTSATKELHPLADFLLHRTRID
jgi:hypothetical protein